MTTASSPAVRVVRATDASPAARDRAFAAAMAQTKAGLLGPINPPIVYLPMDARSPRGVWSHTRATARPSALSVQPAARPSIGARLDHIRASRRAIGGYAAVFNRPSVAGDLVIAPGAFDDVIQSHGVYLFLNHPCDAGVRPSLASTAAGSLHLEEDAYGLWFEAAFRNDPEGVEAYRQVVFQTATGVSWGSEAMRASTSPWGVRTATHLAVWEVSLLTLPHSPRFAGTWVDMNLPARVARASGRHDRGASRRSR